MAAVVKASPGLCFPHTAPAHSISTSCTGWLLLEPEKPELESHYPLKSSRLLKMSIP